MKIKSITKLSEVYDRYDVTVGETSNFYANNILIHNTSGRVARNYQIRPLKWWEKFINKFTPIDRQEMVVLNGTRRVVLNNKKSEQHASSYHPHSMRELASEKIFPYLEPHMHVYFEVVGFEGPNQPIMPRHSLSRVKEGQYKKLYPESITYSYGCADGQFEIYIYRISHVLPSGKEIDMLWEDVMDWCVKHNLKHVPELGRFTFSGDYEALLSRVDSFDGPDPIDKRHPMEGVCVRANSNTWRCYKNKTWVFKVLEGIAKESDQYIDQEEEQSQIEETIEETTEEAI